MGSSQNTDDSSSSVCSLNVIRLIWIIRNQWRSFIQRKHGEKWRTFDRSYRVCVENRVQREKERGKLADKSGTGKNTDTSKYLAFPRGVETEKSRPRSGPTGVGLYIDIPLGAISSPPVRDVIKISAPLLRNARHVRRAEPSGFRKFTFTSRLVQLNFCSGYFALAITALRICGK